MDSFLSEVQLCAPEACQDFVLLHAAQSVVYRSWTAYSLKQLKYARRMRAKILLCFMLPESVICCVQIIESFLTEAAEVCAPEARQIFGVLHAAQSVVHRSRTAFSLKQLKSALLRHAKILASFMLLNLLQTHRGQLPF